MAARWAWTARLISTSAVCEHRLQLRRDRAQSRSQLRRVARVGEWVRARIAVSVVSGTVGGSASGVGVGGLRAAAAGGGAGAGAPRRADDQHPLGLAAEVAAVLEPDGAGELELDEGEALGDGHGRAYRREVRLRQ